jgi:hypothetical protein
MVDAQADGFNDTRSFEAKPRRQIQRIKTGAAIHVDVIQANRMMAHQNFPWARLPKLDIDQLKDLRATQLFKTNGAHDIFFHLSLHFYEI